MKKAVFQLEALTCPSCVKKIESTLSKTEGVGEAKVLFSSSKVRVEFDEDKVNPEKLKNSIRKLGYDVLELKVS